MSSDEDKAAARDPKAHDLLILLPTRHNPLLFIWAPYPERERGDERGQEREQQAGGIRLPKGRPADRADVTGSDRRALAGAPGPSTSRGNHLNLTSTHLPEVCMVEPKWVPDD